MEKHVVKVLSTNFVTHNVKHFVVERPKDYAFTSGQATDVSLNRSGLEDDLHPFTFTSLNNWEDLEFTIKIYTDHDGLTNKLLNINQGDELIIHEVFGAITYKKPGLFIAGGAGVTPFISILRQLRQQNNLKGNTLLFANHTEADIILKDELTDMLGEHFINVIKHPTHGKGQTIDRELLSKYVNKDIANYYICGPDEFVKDITGYLENLGVKKEQIVIEQ